MNDTKKFDLEDIRIKRGLRIVSARCGFAAEDDNQPIALPAGTRLKFDQVIKYRAGSIWRETDFVEVMYTIVQENELRYTQLELPDRRFIRVDMLIFGQHATVLRVLNSKSGPADRSNLSSFDRTRLRALAFARDLT